MCNYAASFFTYKLQNKKMQSHQNMMSDDAAEDGCLTASHRTASPDNVKSFILKRQKLFV